MTASTPNAAGVYAQTVGTYYQNVEIPEIQTRNPTPSDLNYPPGKRWINTANNKVFSLLNILYEQTPPSANWVNLTVSSGAYIPQNGYGLAQLTGSGGIVINNSQVVNYSTILLQRRVSGGTEGQLYVPGSSVNPGSFELSSESNTDASSVYYVIVN